MDEKPRRSNLTLTLKAGESIDIGEDVTVVYRGRKAGTAHAQITVAAPVTTKIRRKKADAAPAELGEKKNEET